MQVFRVFGFRVHRGLGFGIGFSCARCAAGVQLKVYGFVCLFLGNGNSEFDHPHLNSIPTIMKPCKANPCCMTFSQGEVGGGGGERKSSSVRSRL